MNTAKVKPTADMFSLWKTTASIQDERGLALLEVLLYDIFKI